MSMEYYREYFKCGIFTEYILYKVIDRWVYSRITFSQVIPHRRLTSEIQTRCKSDRRESLVCGA